VSRLACAATLALAALSCSRDGGKADCLRARAEARQAATEGDLDHASKLVEEARAQCGERSTLDIDRIQRVIDARRRAQEKQAELEARERTQTERFPVRRLLEWSKLGVVNPEVTGLECAARDSEDYGFCQGQRRGDPKLSVRYWDSQRDAFRYTYVSDTPLACVDVGEHRRVRAWSQDAKSYELCELTQHEVRGLSALVERGPTESTIHVYSQAYLQKDRAFAAAVAGKR
jgi:hypothetical protein